MKKPKRSFELEEDVSGSSDEFEMELNGEQGDDIIDLEDIVELPDDEIDDDVGELDIDVEILDADEDLDFDDLDAKGGSGKGDESETGSLMEFPLGDEDGLELASEPEIGARGDDTDAELSEVSFEEEDYLDSDLKPERDLLGEDLDERLAEFGFSEEEHLEADLKTPEQPSETGHGEEDFQALLDLERLDFEKEVIPGPEEKVGIVEAKEAPASDSAFAVQTPQEAEIVLEEFVTQIENRLVEAVKGIVESRLPDIVRMILREEIERLKKEEG